ncbi:MAG: polysaccharide deacetylase [Clostridia bacterium]|jgi:peptidoglycan/xylan/chitin deacetylase (PgdA/CDA1 family)|nr:polysaccharide deacetylase [Clostridia bacterium]
MIKFKAKFALIFMLIIVLILGACTPQTGVNVTTLTKNPDQTQQPSEEKKPEEDKEIEIPVPQVDYQAIKANENGQVMLLMYHGISNKEDEWVRTPDNFRKDLEVLYQQGYRLITLKDYLDNNIKVEAGYTPVVITFDDGLQNQFNIIEENGEKKIDPDCAVGIMEEFKKKHPDFGQGGTFFVYYSVPFRQKELIKEKYDFLINNGYEIGNHTYTHENLGKESAEGVQKALALNVKYTQEYLPGYDVFALALPYGIAPKDEKFQYAVTGEYEGIKYNNRAILRVGSNPAPAPNHVKYDTTRLPRVRASELNTGGVGMYDYLASFEKHPDKKYISDGNPDTIVIPEEEKENISNDRVGDKQLITYKK